MLDNESLCESQMVPLRNIYERLSTVEWKKSKQKKKLKIRGIVLLKRALSSFDSPRHQRRFSISIFPSFSLILLPFDYDDYDREPELAKKKHNQRKPTSRGRKNKCNKTIINITLAWIRVCLIRRRLKEIQSRGRRSKT
jgi:hypothetical protein